MRTVWPVPRGSTPGIPARSGQSRSRSTPCRCRGAGGDSLAAAPGGGNGPRAYGDTGSRRPPISNGCIPREVRCPPPAVPRTQTCARGLSCRTPPTTSSKPPGVSRPGRGARTILVSRIHINRRGSGRGVCRSISVPCVNVWQQRYYGVSRAVARPGTAVCMYNHRRI